MEKDPSNNPENINQQPAADENAERQPLPYEEEMDKRQHYERLFNEMKQNGTLPEGVTDPYELREYTEEKQAHEAEQSKADKETIRLDKTLLAEIPSIEEPRDRNLAITYLASSFTNDGSRFINDDARLGLEFILDCAKRKDKDSSITELLNNIQPDSQYAHIPMDRISILDELCDEYDNIQQKTNDQNSNLPIVDFCRENRISLPYSGPMFQHYMDEIDNEDSAFSLGEEDFVERPKQDRGILLYMAEKRAQKLEDDRLNDEERALAKNEMAVIGEFYEGKSFGNQFRSNDYFMNVMAKAIHEKKESIDVQSAMHYYAIHKVAEEFDNRRRGYENVQEKLTEGQQILDSFKNNAEA